MAPTKVDVELEVRLLRVDPGSDWLVTVPHTGAMRQAS